MKKQTKLRTFKFKIELQYNELMKYCKKYDINSSQIEMKNDK